MQLTFLSLSRFGRSVALAGAALCALVPSGFAHSLFEPAIIVNEQVVTRFELQQRLTFLELLRAPGNHREEAREALILDRLKQAQIEAAGIEVSDEDIKNAMSDFAKRADLSRAEFIRGLAEGGVAEETFRDFIAVNLGWREVVQQRFLSRARPTDEEVERALAAEDRSTAIQVLLSEIIIPITPQTLELVEEEAKRISRVRSFATFSAEAARFSASESRDRGGRLNWLPITELPPPLRPVLLGLKRGEVTSPIALPNAIALFQLRDVSETAVRAKRYSEIEYAILYLPGGRSPETLAEAARIRTIADTCDDLYGIAKDRPAEALVRETEAPGAISRSVALELAKLDKFEISTTLTSRNGQLMMVMLCNRVASANAKATREEVQIALTQRKLNAFSESYLAKLKAESRIVFK